MVDKVGLISDIERVLQYKTSQKWCVCAKIIVSAADHAQMSEMQLLTRYL